MCTLAISAVAVLKIGCTVPTTQLSGGLFDSSVKWKKNYPTQFLLHLLLDMKYVSIVRSPREKYQGVFSGP